MAANSKIEWCDHTFNPWIGCTKVSAACKNCYAEAMMDKRFGRVKWGPQGHRARTSAANWRKPLAWNEQQWYECMSCGWRGSYSERPAVFRCPKCNSLAVNKTRQRVFCASLADVFEDKPELAVWRYDLLNLIMETQNLIYLLLTKRPENVASMIGYQYGNPWGDGLPTNVWIGTSVENQQTADERIPHLLQIPAVVRFLSVEPLLEPIYLNLEENGRHPDYNWGIDWVIVGGESGPNARPMHPDWVRSIRDQCIAADVPFLFKQWGEYAPLVNLPSDCSIYGMKNKANWYWHEVAPSEASVRVGKHTAGRLLDGREWNEFPR